MKKFFTMNIFFAALAILGVFATVDSSFKTSKSPLDLSLQTDNIEELERVFLKKTQKIKITMAALKKEKVVSEQLLEIKPVKALEAKKLINNTKKISSLPVVKKIKRIVKKANKKTFKTLNRNKIEGLSLSFKEQPTQKAIRLRSNLKTVAWSKLDLKLKNYETTRYAKIKSPKNFDRISTALSAQEKSKNKEVKQVALNSKMEVKEFKDSGDNELVFFDYSKKEKASSFDANEFQKESSKAKTQEKLIRLNRLAQADLTSQKSVNPYLAAIGETFSQGRKRNKRQQKVITPSSALTPQPKSLEPECLNEIAESSVDDSEYELTLDEINTKGRTKEQIRNFEVRFHDDPNIYKEDHGSGKIDFAFSMNSHISVRRATIYAKGYYRTSMDMVFEQGKVVAKVPVFTNDAFNKVLKKSSLDDIGAHILVELDEKTEDVEIDLTKKYVSKLYLDSDYDVVSREDSSYNYILFVGVDPGNAILNFKRVDRKIINKLVYVSEEEIFYEPNFYAKIKSDQFSVYSEGLLSKCKALVNIKADKIKPWNYEGRVKKENLNTVSLSSMIYPLGAKKYIEMSYEGLKENIFVGRWDQKNIIVPTEAYINHILSQFYGRAQSESCVMQLNLAKPVKEIDFNGESSQNDMNMQIKILDKNGQFYQSFSENSERVFLLGQGEGMVSIKIQYADDSYEYLQSYCSESTYIVEQL